MDVVAWIIQWMENPVFVIPPVGHHAAPHLAGVESQQPIVAAKIASISVRWCKVCVIYSINEWTLFSLSSEKTDERFNSAHATYRFWHWWNICLTFSCSTTENWFRLHLQVIKLHRSHTWSPLSLRLILILRPKCHPESKLSFITSETMARLLQTALASRFDFFVRVNPSLATTYFIHNIAA